MELKQTITHKSELGARSRCPIDTCIQHITHLFYPNRETQSRNPKILLSVFVGLFLLTILLSEMFSAAFRTLCREIKEKKHLPNGIFPARLCTMYGLGKCTFQLSLSLFMKTWHVHTRLTILKTRTLPSMPQHHCSL